MSKESEYLDQSKLGHEPAVGHRAKRAEAASIGIMSNLREVIVIQIQLCPILGTAFWQRLRKQWVPGGQRKGGGTWKAYLMERRYLLFPHPASCTALTLLTFRKPPQNAKTIELRASVLFWKVSLPGISNCSLSGKWAVATLPPASSLTNETGKRGK